MSDWDDDVAIEATEIHSSPFKRHTNQKLRNRTAATPQCPE